jgi:pilus assembly protein CpaC
LLIAFALIAVGISSVGERGVRAASNIVNLSAENGVGKVTVVLGQSQTLRVNISFKDIVVGDPETADVAPLTDQTLYILGKKLGTTNVTLFDADKQVAAVIDVQVTHNVGSLGQILRESIPGSRIRVRTVNGRVLLDGLVPSAPAAEKAMALAKQFAGDDVINSLSIAAKQQVNLEVRFVEVNRTAGKALGINWNLTRNGTGSQQGTGVGNPSRPPVPGFFPTMGASPFSTILANVLGNGVAPDVVISALEEKRLARRLAEPNLTTLSGDSASFHAGGEVPVQSCSGVGIQETCSVEFKEFGVKLEFLPVVLDDGLINLTIQPEVSELDPSISVNGNFGFITRKAHTSVELRDGQSFAVAGLLQTVNQKAADQVPWLGDVPVLGALFRSSEFQKRESDLVIIVTPRLVTPVGTRQQLKTPLDDTLSSNEPEFFLLGEQEVSRRELDLRYGGQYGHIIDLPKGRADAVPNK